MKRDIFWNVTKDIDKTTFIEHTFKYGDFDDIVGIFKKFDKRGLAKNYGK